MPVHLLNELVRQLPDGVYISNFKQSNNTVMMLGVAQSNERVSELLRNFSNNTPWISKPELLEITAANVSVGSKDQRRVASFKMQFTLTRPSEVAKASGASSAKTGASGKKQP